MKTALATFAAFLVSNVLTSTSFAATPSANGYGFYDFIIGLIEFIMDIIWGGGNGLV